MGEHDTGKTKFALECGAPADQICFFDDDVKGRATVDDLLATDVKFGAYHDLVKVAEGLREVEFHEACCNLVERIQPGQFQAIVWDTWARFQKTFHPVIVENPAAYRKRWSPMGTIKGAEQWQEAERLEAQFLNHLATLAETVVVVSHLKDFYVGDRKVPGKQVPASGRALERVCTMRVWLKHNPASPVPIGLVLKRIDRMESTPAGLRTTCILPRKIVPRADERSLWDSIGRYFAEPVGLRPPTPDETPDAYELAILEGTLTADQRRTFELMLQAGVGGEPESALASGPDEATLAADAREAIGTPAEIAKLVSERWGVVVTVPQVLKWRKPDQPTG
jgi:hypothetical protein